MASIFASNFALQTIAAFVIFLVGFAALFGSLIAVFAICFGIGKGLYGSAKWASACSARLAIARRE